MSPDPGKAEISEEAFPLLRRQVPGELEGFRLDKALARIFTGHSRTYLKELCDRGVVRVEGRRKAARDPVSQGQWIELRLVDRQVLRQGRRDGLPELLVLHEDGEILVIDKPAGVATHPGGSRLWGTISQAAEARCGEGLPDPGGEGRSGIVHRLDRETSGVLVLAKTEKAWADLQGQFRNRRVEKEYRALVHGEPRFQSDWIDKPIARDPRHPERMKIPAEGGRPSQTFWEVEERFRGFTLLRCLPKTGRTHQIRVHLASVGLGLVCDRVYRSRGQQGPELPPEAPSPERQCLHALRLAFTHPGSGERVDFEAPLPADLEALLGWLRRNLAWKGGRGRGS